MISRRTEYKGLVIRRWSYYRTHILYTKAYRKLMQHIGKCIKQGGAVTMTTYVEHRRRATDGGDTHERCDATLDWNDT